ncbi:MAG: Uma2 family endonuclease [Anaerolineae bacterium]|jgi:Uma2 family endonuclease
MAVEVEVQEKVAVEPRVEVVYLPPLPVYYPESDGKPMAETDTHINQLIYLREALADYFRDDPNIYVAGNLFVYYVEGDPTQVVAPDVFVVKGVPKGERRIFQVWKEGKGPDVVFELTSKKTRYEDLGTKKGLYEVLGVQEYILFDPLGEYLQPRLMMFRLTPEGYRQVEEDPLVSQVLGLELRVEGNLLRLVDPRTGERLLTPLEAQEARRQAEMARRQAEQRAAEEAEARRRAEAELEQLRAELARLKGGEAAG